MRPLSGKEIAVYAFLREACRNGHTTPTIDKISKRSGVSWGSVPYLISRLREAGVLKSEGRASHIVYGVELPAGWRYTKRRKQIFNGSDPRDFGGSDIACMKPWDRERAIARIYREKRARYNAKYPDRVEPVRVALG